MYLISLNHPTRRGIREIREKFFLVQPAYMVPIQVPLRQFDSVKLYFYSTRAAIICCELGREEQCAYGRGENVTVGVMAGSSMLTPPLDRAIYTEYVRRLDSLEGVN
jgi:hypothetical protein